MIIAIIAIAIYILGGAAVYGYVSKTDPYVDDADLTIGMLLWPLWLVVNLVAFIMSLPVRIGEWFSTIIHGRNTR